MIEDMRGLFFIVKGQYVKDSKDSDSVCISGYDPYAPDTTEWYMLLDNVTFYCYACGGDLNKVVKGVKTAITKFKTKQAYFKHVCTVTNEDYYETHYKGEAPLTPEQLSAKMEGRCPRVSPAMKKLYGAVYDAYGDFFADVVEEQEDLAYEALKGQNPFNKSKKLVRKTKSLEKPSGEVKKTPLKKVKSPLKKVEEKAPVAKTLPKRVKPMKKLGVKKLSLG